jgi:hypothetical protein
MQNVYVPANSFDLKDPAMALGGPIPNFLGVMMRTDVICHGGNSLVELYKMIGPQEKTYIVLPEMSMDEVLGLLCIGRFPEICGAPPA